MDDIKAPVAPGLLEDVRSFVNTRDIEARHDVLVEPEGLDRWARSRGLALPSPTPADLAAVVDLREALRAVLLAGHHGDDDDPRSLAIIADAVEWGRVRPVLSSHELRWSARADGTAGLVGHLLSVVAGATVDGTWSRLKACHNDTCQWAFYDHSRSRTGRWCSMQICGNRSKQQRFQSRSAVPGRAAPPT